MAAAACWIIENNKNFWRRYQTSSNHFISLNTCSLTRDVMASQASASSSAKAKNPSMVEMALDAVSSSTDRAGQHGQNLIRF